MNYKTDKTKRSKRRPFRLIIILLLLLLILGGGLKLGLIPGGEHIFGVDGIIPARTENVATDEAPPGKELMIVVKENTIQYNESLITLNELASLIEASAENDQFQVKDDQAIKQTFESVVELLKKYERNYQLVE